MSNSDDLSSTSLTVDVIIPARNEGVTVAQVVSTSKLCRYVRDVIVVDDGSTDDTVEQARAVGANVLERAIEEGSKAHAMADGVAATDAEAILFVDADCLGLTPGHLDAICEPFVEGRAVMSLGTFDYGLWNPFVLRFPPTSGERIIPRWVFEAIPPEKLDGYTIELMISAVVAERRLPTTARVMHGVFHRTKRDKFGTMQGWVRSWKMFFELLGMVRVLRWRSYWFYLRNLTIER